jgi:hypothetical protein
MASFRTAYLQVSVALPPGLMEGLLDNYTTVNGKKATFASVALYALEELHHDLLDLDHLAKAGIVLPDFDPDYRISIPKSDRRAENGFYSMKMPEDFREMWWEILAKHDNNGPAAVHRALLHLYRSVRSFYADNQPGSPFLTRFPLL